MPRKDKGHFAAKHPAGTKADQRIVKALALAEHNYAISCARAHEITVALAVAPRDDGVAMDLQEGRILQCAAWFVWL